MSAACQVCTAPSGDTFLCTDCWAALYADLRDVAGYCVNARGEPMMSLALELELVLSRQERRAKTATVVTGTPERPLPVNLHAGAVRDHLVATLARWVATLCSMHGAPAPDRDTVIENAQWLLHRERMVRDYHEAAVLFSAVTEAVEQARTVIDNRSVRVYVGLCGVKVPATGSEEAFVCTAPLWVDTSYAIARCSFCETVWDALDRWEQYQAQVQATRLEEIRTRFLGARRLAAVLGALGIQVSESGIRKWARAGRIQVSGTDARGRKLYSAGAVLDLLEKASA